MNNHFNRNIIMAALAAFALMLPAAAGEKGPAVSSETALKMLGDGNARFTSGKRVFPNQGTARLEQTKGGQHPFATILSCSDSRVPVEHIFDAGVGDLFIIRVAGNVSGTDEIGTMEYGTEHLHTPLLVVLGHTSCGAVTAVARGDEVGGSIPFLVEKIKPAVALAKKKEGNAFSEKLLDASIRLNVWQAVEDLFRKSPLVAELVKEKKLAVVGAVYHLDNGSVEWLGEHPRQTEFLTGSVHSSGGFGAGTQVTALALSAGAMALLFIAVYALFFRERVGAKTGIAVRLSAGFAALVIAAVIPSSVNSWIISRSSGEVSWIVYAVLPAVAALLSILFSILFAKSMIGSFHRVIKGLKSLVRAGS